MYAPEIVRAQFGDPYPTKGDIWVARQIGFSKLVRAMFYSALILCRCRRVRPLDVHANLKVQPTCVDKTYGVRITALTRRLIQPLTLRSRCLPLAVAESAALASLGIESTLRIAVLAHGGTLGEDDVHAWVCDAQGVRPLSRNPDMCADYEVMVFEKNCNG